MANPKNYETLECLLPPQLQPRASRHSFKQHLEFEAQCLKFCLTI
jgi:hypothetical protein